MKASPILPARPIRAVRIVMNCVPFPVAVVIPALVFASTVAAQESCKLSSIGNAEVAAVRDGRTLALADGRDLRLAAIEAGDASRPALEALAAGQTLRLEKLGAENDRYGRLVAFAYAGETKTSLQQAMIEQGQARVSSRVGDRACAELLLATERAARRATWHLGRPQFRPVKVTRCRPHYGCSGSVCLGGRQGLVGAGKRGHNISELWAPLDARLHCHHSQAQSAGIRYGRH